MHSYRINRGSLNRINSLITSRFTLLSENRVLQLLCPFIVEFAFADANSKSLPLFSPFMI